MQGAAGNADGADEDEPVVANAKRPRDSDGEDEEDGEDNVEEVSLCLGLNYKPLIWVHLAGKGQGASLARSLGLLVSRMQIDSRLKGGSYR